MMDLYRITVVALDNSNTVSDITLPDLETAQLVSFKQTLAKTPTVHVAIARGETFEPVGTWLWSETGSAQWRRADQLL